MIAISVHKALERCMKRIIRRACTVEHEAADAAIPQCV